MYLMHLSSLAVLTEGTAALSFNGQISALVDVCHLMIACSVYMKVVSQEWRRNQPFRAVQSHAVSGVFRNFEGGRPKYLTTLFRTETHVQKIPIEKVLTTFLK
jgi:hypothetical protein